MLSIIKNLFKAKQICPVLGKPCIGSRCMSFRSFYAEWQELELRDNEKGRKEDVWTGRMIGGDVATCAQNVFQRLVLNSKIVQEAEIQEDEPSSIIRP